MITVLFNRYRAPYMLNRQHQALVSAYSATNITVTGSGIIDGNGWCV